MWLPNIFLKCFLNILITIHESHEISHILPGYTHVSLFMCFMIFYDILWEYLYILMKNKWKIVTKHFICSFRQVINHIFSICALFLQQHCIVHYIVYWETRKLSVVWKTNKHKQPKKSALWDPHFPLTKNNQNNKLN